MLGRREGLVVIDEVQRLPVLFETLRPIADDPARKALFLLLGSASWDLIRGISETLAGRILFVDVGGFSLSEVGPAHQDRLWMRGGFPRAWLAPSGAAWTRWMRSFTRTFLERDIPGLGSRVAPEALGRFWRMLAHRHGQLWNASELATSMAISVTAVNHYRDLLAGSFMIRVLPPWFENVGKRLVKSRVPFLSHPARCGTRACGPMSGGAGNATMAATNGSCVTAASCTRCLASKIPDSYRCTRCIGASWAGFALSVPQVFISALAPRRPMTRLAVSGVVDRALRRAGVKSSAQEGHLAPSAQTRGKPVP